MPKVVVEMKNIEKSFPGVHALDNAQLTLYKGEILGLLGENGAGKSTLMNVLGGVYQADSGKIIIDGEEVHLENVVDARDHGIAFIHQEIALVPYLTVAENIFLGRELRTHGMVDKAKMNKEAKKWLEKIGLKVNPAEVVSHLSIAVQQMVEIVKACSLNMKVLIMDEPTSSLSENEVNTLFSTVRALKEQGIGIIYISHKLSEIYEITDRVCIMRDGGYVDTVITKNTSDHELVAKMVGREINNYYVRTYNSPGDVILDVKNISYGKRLHDCSFKVRRGEIVGFYGLVGAGRSELLKAVMGLYPKDSGTVIFRNEDITHLNTLKIQHKGMAIVPENRKLEGLILKNTVGFNISIGTVHKFINHLHVNRKVEDKIINEEVKTLDIKTPSVNQLVANLSGGNQQKVVLAKWLAVKPDLLILDEPTRGIDVGAKAEIYSIMNGLVAQGMAIVMISSEMPETVNMCDRIFVMSEGCIRGELSKEEFAQEKILNLAMTEG